MSMYDSLTCKYPLPDATPEVQAKEFQTQSLECYMHRYEIEEDGRLALYRREYLQGGIPIEEKPEYPKYTGSVTFYADRYEYTALFKDGMLFAIVREME